jgi:hypothetical protein
MTIEYNNYASVEVNEFVYKIMREVDAIDIDADDDYTTIFYDVSLDAIMDYLQYVTVEDLNIAYYNNTLDIVSDGEMYAVIITN